MEKSEAAFRTIGEMAKELGVRTHILRYWEEQFPMLRPLKRAGGRRHYRADDVQLLHQISRLLNQEGYTIKGARKALQQGSDSPPLEQPEPSAFAFAGTSSSAPAAASSRDIDVAALRRIREQLASALAAA